eukprot:269420-Rhodomonas_salina.2
MVSAPFCHQVQVIHPAICCADCGLMWVCVCVCVCVWEQGRREERAAGSRRGIQRVHAEESGVDGAEAGVQHGVRGIVERAVADRRERRGLGASGLRSGLSRVQPTAVKKTCWAAAVCLFLRKEHEIT